MSDSRVRIWFALFVLAIFCLGLASGVLIGRRMAPGPFGLPGTFGARGDGRGPGPGGPRPEVLTEQLTRDLDLDAAQRSQLERVLGDSRDRVEAFRRDTRERFEGEQRALRNEIRKVLRPDQQERFDRWVEQSRALRGGPGRGRGLPR